MGHILIIDDNSELADMFVEVFYEYGISAIAFYDAETAMGYVENTTNRISLMLVDINLGGISGIQFSKNLHKVNPDIPVVLFSGALDGDTDTSSTHIIRVLQKPVNIPDLINLIKIHGK